MGDPVDGALVPTSTSRRATTQHLDIVLTDIKDHAGAPTARTYRAVKSDAMKFAVRYGAITVKPAREVDAIEARPKSPPSRPRSSYTEISVNWYW